MKKMIVTGMAFALAMATNSNAQEDNPSAIVTGDGATVLTEPWGSLHTYFAGDTHSTKDVLAAVVVIKAGEENHPPHKHSEEEYMMLLSGEGEWHLNGKDTKASVGDMLYAAPWDIHGLKNVGDGPMKFVVWKWHGKGVNPMSEGD